MFWFILFGAIGLIGGIVLVIALAKAEYFEPISLLGIFLLFTAGIMIGGIIQLVIPISKSDFNEVINTYTLADISKGYEIDKPIYLYEKKMKDGSYKPYFIPVDPTASAQYGKIDYVVDKKYKTPSITIYNYERNNWFWTTARKDETEEYEHSIIKIAPEYIYYETGEE